MKYKLVCFDVDGTLVDNLEYSWQIFHDYFQVDGRRRRKAKEAFYSGKISYLEWARHDINMWVELGKKRDDFISAIKNAKLRLMNGAQDTLSKLKEKGLKLAIISGSISIIPEFLIPDFENIFDDVYLSWIFFDDDGSIKKIKPTAYDMEHKATALKEIAEKEGIELSECVFVGDHDNDVKIAEEAGLSIAFNAHSEELKNVSNVNVEKKDLREILKYIL